MLGELLLLVKKDRGCLSGMRLCTREVEAGEGCCY